MEILIKEETRFMNMAQRLKSRTVALHFKIEELGDRLGVLIKFKLIREEAEKKVVRAKFVEAEKTLSMIRTL